MRDTGSGMDAETQTQIFEPFFTTKEEGKGTGLGLSTVFGIVHQSGGRIAVDSRAGARHDVHDLPAARRGRPRRRGRAPGRRRGRPGSGSVLVVEDDDAVRRFVQAVLEPAGYDVRVASGGEEALLGADADLLITDILMPGMNGRELAERIRERAPETARDVHLGLRGQGRVARGRGALPGQAVHAE